MIIPDLNLLLYAHDQTSPHHIAASAWWSRCMNGSEEVGLVSVVIFGFVRIATHPKVFLSPCSIAEATNLVNSWLARPQCHVVTPSSANIQGVLALLQQAGTGGNLTTDAQIAALALQEKAIVHTNDTDFHRFSGLRWHNPLTGKSGIA